MKTKLITLFFALMAAMAIDAQEINVVNLADVANYIDFQALSISDPAMTQHTVTSTDPYELANGTILRGFQKSDGSEAYNWWNVRETYNMTLPTPTWEGVDSLVVGTMFRAASHCTIELGAFNTSAEGGLAVFYQPNGDSERGVEITVYGEVVEGTNLTGSGMKIDGVRPGYVGVITLPAGSYDVGDVVIKVVTNTCNIFGVAIEELSEYKITTNVLPDNSGTVDYTHGKLTASPHYGYHFTQWSDGVTDNPRTIELTQDTTLTAEFAKNTYTISTTSANPEWGTTAGDTAALYLDEVEISAIPNYGYHFVQWSDREYICHDWWDGVCYSGPWGDYNTEPTRTIVVERDSVITATFAKNVYTITKNAEHGTISGNSSAEYLDFVTLTVTPDYGYHFTQWSDGLKDNPRIAQITQDTTFTAEFAYDRVGTCGKDLALVWSYDPANKVLTIGNAGEFTENMQFGAEAPGEMEELVIGNNVTAIGENAFAGISTLKKVTIGESVKTIYDRAFYNCVNLETIFNYRPTPTNAYSTAFDGVDKFECILYVLPNSIDMYKNASVWRDFYYTYAIGAEDATVTTNDVQVEPQDNAATLTWPTSNNAVSYTIEITKDGVVFCRLTFNANGQLTGIAYAPGRDGQSMAPAAVMTASGLQFTVTCLVSNTQYGYNVTAKDANEQPIATYSGSFTTTSEGVHTGIDNTAVEPGITKILRNGEVLILRDGKTYTAQGQEVR